MKTIKPLPSAELIRECLSYNPLTGRFHWLTDRGRRIKAGDVAGRVKSTGYVGIKINGSEYLAHRLAWKLVYGADPTCVVDHLDGNRQNNAISNLQDTSTRQNCRRETSAKRPLPRGVRLTPSGKYKASGRIDGKVTHLGTYQTAEEAAMAYKAATC